MVSLHIETARFKSPGHKNELCFFWDTLPRRLPAEISGWSEPAYFLTSFKLVGLMAFDGWQLTWQVLFPIGFHISEKELIRGGVNVGVFYLGACEVAGSLQASLAGSHGFWNQAHLFLSKGKVDTETMRQNAKRIKTIYHDVDSTCFNYFPNLLWLADLWEWS